jgi:hypothetical protein
MTLIKNLRLFGLPLGLLLSTAALQANTIGPNCGSCFGATYTLTDLGLQSSTATTQTFRMSYKINTTGYTGSSSDYIQQVGLKVTSNANSLVSAALVSSPSGTWAVSLNKNVNNNGCTGNGSGWVCAAGPVNVTVANGSTYTWIFDIVVKNGTLLTAVNQASIKANYNPPNGLIVSENITLDAAIPEPVSLSLLVGGLGVWGLTQRRRGKTAV